MTTAMLATPLPPGGGIIARLPAARAFGAASMRTSRGTGAPAPETTWPPDDEFWRTPWHGRPTRPSSIRRSEIPGRRLRPRRPVRAAPSRVPHGPRTRTASGPPPDPIPTPPPEPPPNPTPVPPGPDARSGAQAAGPRPGPRSVTGTGPDQVMPSMGHPGPTEARVA
ncbi:hypothetical protein GCM10017744_018580 [Streptomyces antimycoticus]